MHWKSFALHITSTKNNDFNDTVNLLRLFGACFSCLILFKELSLPYVLQDHTVTLEPAGSQLVVHSGNASVICGGGF